MSKKWISYTIVHYPELKEIHAMIQKISFSPSIIKLRAL